MHVGMAVVFQNPGHRRADAEVWRDELALADAAETLGYESIWTVEHHFTDYAMCPDAVQFLTYMAGRTTAAQLGTMVVVLPWHDPVRVAEQVAVLDAVSDGRVVLGIGRGLGRVEFEGFRVPMDQSRARFVESARILLEGLESGFVEHRGEVFDQPRREIRPNPSASFRGRTYAAAVSPESMPLMAELGVGVLVIPQKPWEVVADDLATYRGVYHDVNGVDAPAPIVAGWVMCDPDGDRAAELAHRYIGGYYRSVLDHYELAGDHFAGTKGYEYYSGMADKINEYGDDEAVRFFTDLHVFGTPEQCYERVMNIRSRIGCDHFVGVFGYAGLPQAEAERSMRVFASEVAPELRVVAPVLA